MAYNRRAFGFTIAKRDLEREILHGAESEREKLSFNHLSIPQSIGEEKAKQPRSIM